MFKRLRVKPEPRTNTINGEISISQLIGDASLPVTIRALNSLPENPKLRLYRALIPVQVLAEFDINPRTWKNPDKLQQVRLEAEAGSDKVKITAWYGEDIRNEFFYLELADNQYSGIDLNFLVANNPLAERFRTDVDDTGNETLFGTVHRNHGEEEKAKGAGLAPGQIREGLRSSSIVFNHIETFLTMMSHHAFFLEPLSYVSAWIFEKRGFAYSKGHQLMDIIHKEFQPGGELHKALDGSTPFRQSDQWNTVRGRAWAIHDGILEKIDRKWDDLKMIKQVGRHAGVNTFPDAKY
ncbi:MAG: hypothetical protein KJZ77_12325 [Anaerolineales bacterium]|nr:hypothetical protein [Anaerolineales bacterium]